MTSYGPTEEHLLGFDAREMLPTAEGWTAERKQSLLLADVRKPLSADCAAWLSLYNDDTGVPRPGVPGLIPPKWTGPNAGLWEDLVSLEWHLATAHVEHSVLARSFYLARGRRFFAGTEELRPVR